MIQRQLTKVIINDQKPGFVNIVYGARRVGKTILLDQILSNYDSRKVLKLNGDTKEAQNALENTSETNLTNIVKDHDIIVIDEAQRVPNIGLSLKIIIDKFPQKKIFVTGSSSLELSKGVQEALTGRTIKYKLFPLSTKELSSEVEKFKLPSILEDQLIYGGYPYLRQLPTLKQKQEYLNSITRDYLFRDLFELEKFNNPENVKKIVTLLAFQIGSEVSLNELARQVLISAKTVARYIDLLEKSFVIFGIGAFSGNLRSEVSRGKKYYFYDNGIRNALINQFHGLDSRADTGALWENFLVVERLKKKEYEKDFAPNYFWRDYSNSEIDWLEQSADGLAAFEFKWGRSSNYRTPKLFKEKYFVEVDLVDRSNYLDFIL